MNANTRRIVVSGIVASLVLAMWEMVVEALLAEGAGFFGPPIAIGATLARDLQGSSNPIPFDGVALGLGLIGHMMNSIILAAVFGLFASRLTLSKSGTIALGMGWGIAVFAMMWFVVAPAIDPLMLNLNAAAFFVAHLMWGAALGVAWALYGDRGTTATRPG